MNRDKWLASKRIVYPEGDSEVLPQLEPNHPEDDACLTTYEAMHALKTHVGNILDTWACVIMRVWRCNLPQTQGLLLWKAMMKKTNHKSGPDRAQKTKTNYLFKKQQQLIRLSG